MPEAVFFGYIIYFDYGHSSLIFVRPQYDGSHLQGGQD
jgi:hypothetical protein